MRSQPNFSVGQEGADALLEIHLEGAPERRELRGGDIYDALLECDAASRIPAEEPQACAGTIGELLSRDTVKRAFPKALCLPAGDGKSFYVSCEGLVLSKWKKSRLEAWSDAASSVVFSHPAPPQASAGAETEPYPFNLSDKRVLDAVQNTDYAKEAIAAKLMCMTGDQKMSLYRAVVSLAQPATPEPDWKGIANNLASALGLFLEEWRDAGMNELFAGVSKSEIALARYQEATCQVTK